ncbi:MAG: glutathione S-transferase [Alphaproteobacteria bacterium]
MKVFYTGNSPYARRARLAARASGLDVEEVDVAPLDSPTNPLRDKGPGVKVPGLETDAGTYICETLLITNYLNQKSGGRLQPSEPAAAEAALENEGVGSLLMDSLFLRSHEKRRAEGEKSPGVIEKEAGRATRCYDALAGLLSGKPAELNSGTIAAVAALGYADWRHAEDDWRKGREGLAKWFEDMHGLPDVAETKPEF